MTVGPLSRAELVRSLESRSNSGTKGAVLQPASLSGPAPALPQLAHGFPSGSFAYVGSSPDSSRDVSPARQASFSGSHAHFLSEWTSSVRASVTEAPNAPLPCSAAPSLNTDVVLNEMPSFSYERGLRALWLDRHPSLQGSSQYSCHEDCESKAHQLVMAMASPAQPPPSDEAQHGSNTCKPVKPTCQPDCLAYCPSWHISRSLVWSLAEQYVITSAPPPSPPPSPSPFVVNLRDIPSASSPCQTCTQSTLAVCSVNPTASAQSPAIVAAAAAANSSCPAPPPQAAAAAAAFPSPCDAAVEPASFPGGSPRRMEPPPLPSGIGPVGLSSPKAADHHHNVPGSSPARRLRRAALCLVAKSRMELKRSMRAEEELQLEATAVITTGGATEAEGEVQGEGERPAKKTAGSLRSGSLRMSQIVSEAVADALATSPASRTVVRRRVRALVAGVSVTYTTVSLAGCAAALTHADFSNDFANSAKAVLDFLFTAPSVTGIASDLIQIGVAVGLGMAQRR